MIINEIIRKLIEKRTLIVICGPTASGKTEVSINLSEFLDIEIISADSRQIYKYLDFGTAKPTKAELNAVKHHFIDTLSPEEAYSSGKFGDDAEIIADELFWKNRLPVVVGGSGLYIKSLCEGFFEESGINNLQETRIQLEEKLEREGIDSLYEELKNTDKESYHKYSDKNPRRIIRALEYYYSTGSPLSLDHKDKSKPRDFNALYFAIEMPREDLYDKINRRTHLMWESGLVDETKKVLEMGFSPSLNSLNTVGYKETIAYLNNEIDEVQAITEIQKNTRRYAKRQLTWFRRNENIHWLKKENDISYAHQIMKIISDLK